MTRTATHPLVIDAAPAWALTLAWDLSAKAGRALAERVGAEGDTAVAVELSVEPADPGQASVRLLLVLSSGARRELRAAAGVRALWRREPDFEHFDAPGVVQCTARRGDETTLIYARCPWLAQAGVPAGSYSLRTGA